jgi:hypothetical protein
VASLPVSGSPVSACGSLEKVYGLLVVVCTLLVTGPSLHLAARSLPEFFAAVWEFRVFISLLELMLFAAYLVSHLPAFF